MADVITDMRLSAYLDDESIVDSPRSREIIRLVNALITEEWRNPVDPAPVKVELLALSVAARAWFAKPGRGPLESLTRSFDDSSRTERYAVPGGSASGEVYLTDDERALLNGSGSRRVASISLTVPRTFRAW